MNACAAVKMILPIPLTNRSLHDTSEGGIDSCQTLPGHDVRRRGNVPVLHPFDADVLTSFLGLEHVKIRHEYLHARLGVIRVYPFTSWSW